MNRLIKRGWIVLAVGVLLVTACSAQARSHRSSKCSMRGSKTVIANDQVRVFRRETPSFTITYACRYARGKRITLSRADSGIGSGEYTSHETLAGNVVAYVTVPFDDSQRYNTEFKGFASTVHVLHVRTGKRYSAPAVPNVIPSTVESLVLIGNGSTAWIGGGGIGFEVRRLSIDGKVSLLAGGADIDQTSLAAGGSKVYWTQGGSPRSALLG